MPVRFRGLTVDCGYRLDLLIENKVVVEVKAVDALAPIHRTQLRTYLRLAECPVGLILNFNVPLLKHGIQRVVNRRCLTAEELAMFGPASDEDVGKGGGRDAADHAPDD